MEELQETEIAPEIITPEDIEEPDALTEAFAEAELAAGIPTEDHRVEMQTTPYEEEVIEVPREDIEEPAALTEAFAAAELAAEMPAEDHRADAVLSPYEEEVIEIPEEETEEPPAEALHEDNRAEIFMPPYEEEVTDVPDQENIEAQAENAAPAEIAQPAAEVQAEETAGPKHYGTFGDIDDDVFEEIADIGSISFAFAPKTPETPVAPEPPSAESHAEETAEPNITADTKPGAHDTRDEIGRLMSQELISADYLAFENSRQHEHDAEATEEPEVFTAEAEVHVEPLHTESETQNVSKYHDEKMPYTFMWWLDKTRKEHAGVYQPFKLDTTQAIRHTAADTLQQQYYENIFHINTIDELDKSVSKQSVEFDMQNKEDRIIQKFISDEPQIGPPAGDKLNIENKAKRSSEDQDELVTETLAKIYIDQMLYHKAINTYKKLMLKFPEKSRYFADQIEFLERKIN
jgi:hypothetical protein